MTHQFTQRELATLLAALRFWQRSLDAQDGVIPFTEHFDGLVTPLTVEEIDDLCEQINSPSAA